MHNFLFFDTETTGVDLDSSRIVELAWLVCSPDGKEIKSKKRSYQERTHPTLQKNLW